MDAGTAAARGRDNTSLAYDVASLKRLKYSAAGQADGGRHEAARQFEAVFLQQMLASMRKAIPQSHLLGDSAGHGQAQDMLDAQWAQTLSERGMGLAPVLERQLGGPAQAKAPIAEPAVVEQGSKASADAPRALAASDSLSAIREQRAMAARAATHDSPPLVELSTSAGAAQPLLAFEAERGTGAPAPHVAAFVARLQAPAAQAAARTGLSSRLILAQAALETGWGRHETQTATGQPSHNVFNIKATGWQGETTRVATHEYRNGRAEATREGFRVYDSYDQAFADYARLIDTAPRYAPARAASSPTSAARALQDAGYATDPNYADKLVAIMQHLDTGHTAGGLFASGAGTLIDLNASAGTALVG